MSQRLTLDEAAETMRKSRRWMLEWLRKHPRDAQGRLYYTPVGRDKVFHPHDITRIEDALREEKQCHSRSGRRVKAKRQTSKSEAPISDATWKLAAELTNEPSLASGCGTSKSASSSTANIQRPQLNVIQGSRHS